MTFEADIPIAFMSEAPVQSRELPRSFSGEWVAAVRRLRTGDTGFRQTRRSPTHSRHCTEMLAQKKAPAIVIGGACAPVSYPGSQARSLNWQRRAKLACEYRIAQSWLCAGRDAFGHRSPCGSGLARESGVSGDIDAGCDGLFASKPAHTGSRTVGYLCGLSSNRKNRSRTCT
jgi:hypothetical protein